MLLLLFLIVLPEFILANVIIFIKTVKLLLLLGTKGKAWQCVSQVSKNELMKEW